MHEQAKLQDELEYCTAQAQAVKEMQLYDQYAVAEYEAMTAACDTQQFMTVLQCERGYHAAYSNAMSDSVNDAYTTVTSAHIAIDELREHESILLQQQQVRTMYENYQHYVVAISCA
jgi:mannitol-specific phosphotransferase system IIBC component